MITREQKNEILFLIGEIISLEKDLSFEKPFPHFYEVHLHQFFC